MSVKSCPLCGNKIDEGEIFCSNCQVLAKGQILNIEENDKQSPNNKKIPPSILFFLVGCFLCLVLYGVSYYFSKQAASKGETESEIWEESLTKNSPLEYSKYLLRFPNGKFAEEAHKSIVKLRQKEQDDWVELLKSAAINDYATFLLDYPETSHKRDARYRMDSLTWVLTCKANSKDALNAYIQKVKQGSVVGSYVTIAQKKYDYLDQMQKISNDSIENFRPAIDRFFIALSNPKLSGLEDVLNSQISDFYKQKDVSNLQVIDSIRADIKTKKIQKIYYKPNYEIISATRDNLGIYFIQVKLNREDVYSKKKKILTTQSIQIALNTNNRVQGICQ